MLNILEVLLGSLTSHTIFPEFPTRCFKCGCQHHLLSRESQFPNGCGSEFGGEGVEVLIIVEVEVSRFSKVSTQGEAHKKWLSDQ